MWHDLSSAVTNKNACRKFQQGTARKQYDAKKQNLCIWVEVQRKLQVFSTL
jgi:hypothetical protein